MNKKQIYFLGIGGIGMSALARYYKAKGYAVSGYDRTQTQLTRELEGEGIPVHYSAQIPLLENLAQDTLVVSVSFIPLPFLKISRNFSISKITVSEC